MTAVTNAPGRFYVFLDTETTSLRPDRRVWEVAGIVRDPRVGPASDTEFAYMIERGDLDLGNADPTSLKIGRFYDRHPQERVKSSPELKVAAVADLVKVRPEMMVMHALEIATRDAIIIGAVPNFDTEVLDKRMRAHGLCPAWHYHLADVETLAAGYLGITPPWSFDEILKEFGLAYDEDDRHTALGDARMVRDLYDRVMGTERQQAQQAAAEFVDALHEGNQP